MEEQSKIHERRGNTNSSDIQQKSVSHQTSGEIFGKSKLSPRDSRNDPPQAVPRAVYVPNEYEKSLEPIPPLRISIPNPKRTLMPLDKPAVCDICGKKFARASHCQQHRKTHFLQDNQDMALPTQVDDKSVLRNMNSELPSSVYQANLAPSHLNIHKSEQILANKSVETENTDGNSDQKITPDIDPYSLALGSVSSLSKPRERFSYPFYPSMVPQRSQIFTSDASDGKTEKPFTCEICHKTFARRDTLICHQRTHDGMKPFHCNICNKDFSRRDKLQCHTRIHSGERPYPCSFCPRAFSQSDKLKCHMRTHTGERPHACDLCERRFARRDTLHCHRRTHTGEKPFPCSVCGKCFARKDKLTCHLRIHSGEKPYVCGTCGKQFARSDKLCRHQLTHDTGRVLMPGNGLSVNVNHQPDTPSNLSLSPLATAKPDRSIAAADVSLPNIENTSKMHFPHQGLPPVFPTVNSNLGNLLWQRQTIY